MRNSTIDILKGITICLVVLGHTIQYCNGDNYLHQSLFFDNILFKVIYMFHMPLFMGISGFLFYSTQQRKTAKEIIISKVRSIYIPIIGYALFSSFIIFSVCPKSYTWYISSFFYDITGLSQTLWFLWSLMANIAIFVITKSLCRRNNEILLGVLGVATYFIPDEWIPNLYKSMFVSFLVGYSIAEKKIIFDVLKHRRTVFVMAAIVFGICMVLYDTQCYFYFNNFHNMDVKYKIYVDIVRIISAISGCYVIYILSAYIAKVGGAIIKPITFIGIYTLPIYCIHRVVLPWLSNLTPDFSYSLIRTLVVTIAIIILCLCISYVMEKNKITRILFLGKKP